MIPRKQWITTLSITALIGPFVQLGLRPDLLANENLAADEVDELVVVADDDFSDG